MVSHDEFSKAQAKGAKMRAAIPAAVTARYDRSMGRVVIHLATGLDVAFLPRDVQGLEKAKPADLAKIEISPSGLALHFPALDADLYLPALLEGFFGSEKWMAARLGAKGGKVRSVAKALSSRKNGKLGGRPRKRVAA
jgi:hypothetical protein